MSTILKALRRLEEEKTRGGAPRPLREEVASGPRERSRRRGGAPWTLLGALLLGAGLGASAWWFWPYERAAEPVEIASAGDATPAIEPAAPSAALGAPGAPAEADAQDTPLSEEQMLEALRAESPDLPEDAFESQVEVVQRPPAEPRIARVEPKPEEAAPAVPASPERRVAVARKRAEVRAAAEAVSPAAPAAAPPSPSVRETPQTPPRPAITSAPAPVATRPAPAQPAVPDDERDWPVTSEWVEPPTPPEPTRIDASHSASVAAPAPMPTAADFKVKRTQWHPERARRSADLVLAGKDRSVHEGDVVGDYVVSEIRPSGVVLTRDGEQIERGIGK